MRHHILYIPGIRDHHTYGQNFAIQLWRLFGFTPHYFPLTWNRKDGFEAKLTRLLDKIDSLQANGDFVSLVGVSAGASAVVNAYARRKTIVGVVSICGKIKHPETVKPDVTRVNPDFGESLEELPRSLALIGMEGIGRILNLHPRRDESVPPKDTIIAGSAERIVSGWSHKSGVFFGVVIGAPIIAKFLRLLEAAKF